MRKEEIYRIAILGPYSLTFSFKLERRDQARSAGKKSHMKLYSTICAKNVDQLVG